MKKNTKRTLSLVLIAFLLFLTLIFTLASCSAGQLSYESTEFFALNTFIEIKINRTEKSAELLKDCREIVLKSEKIFSMTDEQSELYKINESEHLKITLSRRMSALIKKSLELARDTEGAFDITAGALSKLWCISDDDTYIPAQSEIEKALEHVGYNLISIDENNLITTDNDTVLDLGAIAKGEIAGQLYDYLVQNGVEYGIISLGGNICTIGTKPDNENYRVSVRDPFGDGYIGILSLGGGEFVSVAGGYERYKEVNGVKYHHIFDTSTGYPSNSGLASVAVISNDPMLADALSTALFVMGKDEALEYCENSEYEFGAVLIDEKGEITLSPDFEYTFTEK